MTITPPQPPLPPSHSSSSSPPNRPPLPSSYNVIPAGKRKRRSKSKAKSKKSKSRSKPKSKRAKKPDKARSTRKGTSIYKGVTRHRASGRFEAHIWDKTWENPFKKKRGRQVYLGAFVDEVDAARAHDLAALKFWGPGTILNFPSIIYVDECKAMQAMTKEGVLASLRRRSSGFARGVSKYRGVARYHGDDRWEARLGYKDGDKYHYLGVYSTKEEAAQAYDLAALEFRGPNTVTNFESSVYMRSPRPEPEQEQEQEQEPEPEQEPRAVPMEPTEPIDQAVPNENTMGLSSWAFGMDSDFGAHPPLDVFGPCPPLLDWYGGITNDISFEENIESLFDGFEVSGGNNENRSDGFDENFVPGEAGPGGWFEGGHGVSSELSFVPPSN